MTRAATRAILALVALTCARSARSADEGKGEGASVPKPAEPDPAWVAEADETAAYLRREVVKGVAAGRTERVYVEFAGALVRGKVVAASETELVVSTPAARMSFRWEKLKPRRFYLVARKYAPDEARVHARLARYCVVKALPEEAGKEIDRAIELDPAMRGELRRVREHLAGARASKIATKMERAAGAARGPAWGAKGSAAPAPGAVRTTDKVSAVLEKLGKRHFMLGMTSGPGDKWMEETRAAGSRWDMRYQYLAGGVNVPRSWKEWNSPPGAFVSNYLRESERLGTIPVFSWYQMFQSKPGGGGEARANRTNCENASTMKQYLSDVKLFMQKAAEFRKPVILHAEPDLWGFALIAGEFRPNDFDKIRAVVKSTGMPELAELDDTMAGFGRAFVALRDRYAPNVLLGWHASKWGNPAPRKFAEACMKCGEWDIIFVDPSDRDSGWKLAHGYHTAGAWWKEADFASFRDWSGELSRITGLPVIAWQIPVGNTIMAACNNTGGHYMDNRVQHWLEDYPRNPNIAEWAKRGFIGLLFGGGAGGCTGVHDSRRDGITNPEPVEGNRGEQSRFPDDDGGYLRLRAAEYYKSPLPFDLREGK